MLPLRLSRDSKRWSVVQHIFVSKAAMVSIDNFTRVSFKFTVGDLKIVVLTGMDVPDQYICSKSNFKKKMNEFRIYFNKFIRYVFGGQPFQLE